MFKTFLYKFIGIQNSAFLMNMSPFQLKGLFIHAITSMFPNLPSLILEGQLDESRL